MAKCQRRLCKAQESQFGLGILQISMGSGFTMLQVSLTCKLGLKWYEFQCGIENTPQVTWPMPQFGLGWYPCHAMRYATRRFAWKRLADRVSRTKTEWKKLLQLQRETQRETTGAICVKCLSRSSPRPQPSSSSRSARFPTAKGKKSTKVEPEKSFGPKNMKNSVSCKLQIGSSVCHLDDIFTMSPLHREHRNLELPGPSLRRNVGTCMSFMNV